MPIKTIALVIFDTAEAGWIIEKTAALAGHFGAHVLGLHPYTAAVFAGMATEPMIFPTFEDWELEESNKIQEKFEAEGRNNDLQTEFRRQSLLYGGERFLLSSVRSADLIVMGTNAPDSRSPDNRAMASQIIRHAGRPVLVLPPGAELPGPAESLVIGWSDTREAARAAHDALTLAKPGARIHVVSLTSRAGGKEAGLGTDEDFAAALDRLGYEVTVDERIASAEDRAEELLRVAGEKGADLLVTGAFGHSQVYDFVIGAVTSHLLEHATVPLLLSK